MSEPSFMPERVRRHTLGAALAITVTLAALAAGVDDASASAGDSEKDGGIMVAAAMSLRKALPPMIDTFQRQSSGAKVAATYGASGDLRRQVEGGAPIDAVIFASASDVDFLIERQQIAGGKHVVASNALVLIGPRGAQPLAFERIDSVPDGEYIAIGDPETVPAGRYAKQVLQALNKWDAVRDRMVFAGHVAAVLQYARRGEVAAAIVYSTDVIDVEDVVVLDRARGPWAPRIETVAAVVVGGNQTRARAFVDFLETPAARALFAAHGFGPPGEGPAEIAP